MMVTPTEQNGYNEILYDRLVLVDKGKGDYGTLEYTYEGSLGTYEVRIAESITDDGKVLYVYYNHKMMVNLHPAERKLVSFSTRLPSQT